MDNKSRSDIDEYEDGISVITATFKGEKYISNLLNSIKEQELSPELFEHLIVINGELDSTPQILEDFKTENPDINVRVFYSEFANASNARNIGIREANRKYITFVDDDDYISPNYLKEFYENAAENRIVIAGFLDVEEDTGKISDSYFTDELKSNSGLVKKPYNKLVGALTISVCKLIPAAKLGDLKFNTKLKSGIDVSFYSQLYSKNKFEFYVINLKKGAIYYRLHRQNSMSKRPLSYEFNIIQRLNVIKDLNQSIEITFDEETRKFITGKIKAQTRFINDYLTQNPHDVGRVIDEIDRCNLNYFPYNHMNKNLAKKLVISFNFPPYITASGNTVAKRISQKGEIVDVLYNEMAKGVDKDLNSIADEFIDRKMVTKSMPTFGSWNGIKQFLNEGMDKIEEVIMEKGEYESIYSRSMFPASHFLAFEYKIRYPNVKWSAEFSDPIIYDIKGQERNSNIDDPEYIRKINYFIAEQGFQSYNSNNLFFLCEYLPYLFADEIIFTNEYQKKFMANKFPYPEIVDLIEKKSKIEAHPIPREKLYYLKESDYLLDENYVNIAYFGAFYESRNMNDVFLALYLLDPTCRERCKIHFFTSDFKNFKDELECEPNKDQIVVNPYVSFFEFLNLSTKFDCLMVNDTTTQKQEINPYLPSKLSDYLGSGTDIWIIHEKNSAMSKYDVKYKSLLNNIKSISSTLEKIIKDHEIDKYKVTPNLEFLNI